MSLLHARLILFPHLLKQARLTRRFVFGVGARANLRLGESVLSLDDVYTRVRRTYL